MKLHNMELRELYSPEGSQLRHDQLEMLEMLKVLARILEENDIPWWLSSGTLLGAARHNGFIPWDDDMDIVMLRKDYKRFLRVMKKYESEEYVFHSMCSDVEYVNSFGKFRKRAGCVNSKNRRNEYYKWRGVGIDVFSIEKTNYAAARISSVIYNNLQHPTVYIRVAWIRRLLIRLVEFLCLGLINPFLRIVGLLNPKKQYHYSLGTGWAKHVFYMHDTFPLATACFEDSDMPVPHDVDSYLSNVYGDWRAIPGEDVIMKSIHCREYMDEIQARKNNSTGNCDNI